MPDFSSEAYASYVKLCRELGQESECHMCSGYGKIAHDKEPGGEYAFVRCPFCQGLGQLYPTLADWLEMLETAGETKIEIRRLDEGGYDLWTSTAHFAKAPTREEAAARLYVAVTRSPVDPAPPPAAR